MAVQGTVSGLWKTVRIPTSRMGLLPDTENCRLRMRRECRERFPLQPISKESASYRSRHASRHVRHARAVMHVGIAYLRWRGKRSRHSRRMRTRNFAYLARGPWSSDALLLFQNPLLCNPKFMLKPANHTFGNASQHHPSDGSTATTLRLWNSLAFPFLF